MLQLSSGLPHGNLITKLVIGKRIIYKPAYLQSSTPTTTTAAAAAATTTTATATTTTTTTTATSATTTQNPVLAWKRPVCSSQALSAQASVVRLMDKNPA